MSLFRRASDANYVLPETLAVCAAFTTAPTAARKALINTMINSLVVCGAWDRMDFLYVLAAADSQAARINWKNPASLTLSASGTLTFTADRGYTGDGATGILATGYNPTTASLGLSLNDVHAAAFLLTAGTSTAFDFLSDNVRLRVRGRTNASQPQACLSTATGTIGAGGASAPDHCLGNRIDSANQDIYINGAFSNTSATASTLLTTGLSLLGNTTAAQFSDRQMAIAHCGRGLRAPHVFCSYKAFQTYLTALGAI